MTVLNFSIYCVLLIVCIGNSAAKATCGPNEVLQDCPKKCAYDTCPRDEFHDKTPCLKSTTCPAPECKCQFNYRRADNGTCIPTEKCPPFKCSGPNEYFDPCPSYCPGDDCSNANPTGECPFYLLLVVECSPSCRCIPHHWRKDGVCVPYLECPGVKRLLEEQRNGNTQNVTENSFETFSL